MGFSPWGVFVTRVEWIFVLTLGRVCPPTAALLWKKHLFRNRDVYEIVDCCLIAAARLFRAKLSFVEWREAFVVAGRGRRLSLSLGNIAATSDSRHSGVLGWDKALERGSEGKLEASFLDTTFVKLELTEF